MRLPVQPPRRSVAPATGRGTGFTLIELILVMALLVAVAGMLAPSLGGFFRGRALDAEARRFVTLSRYARSAAVSEGVPMLLWVDPVQRTYGVVEEVNYTGAEPRRLTYALAPKLTLEVDPSIPAASVAGVFPGLSGTAAGSGPVPQASGTMLAAGRSGMTVIRFQTDGLVDPMSPVALWLREEAPQGGRPSTDPAAGAVWLTQNPGRNGYEIQTNQTAWVRR